jgi:hypothetical protein
LTCFLAFGLVDEVKTLLLVLLFCSGCGRSESETYYRSWQSNNLVRAETLRERESVAYASGQQVNRYQLIRRELLSPMLFDTATGTLYEQDGPNWEHVTSFWTNRPVSE